MEPYQSTAGSALPLASQSGGGVVPPNVMVNTTFGDSPAPEIPRAMERLDMAVTGLEQGLEELSMRMGSLMVPAAPPSNITAMADAPYESDLAERIRVLSERVDAMRVQVASRSARLQV